MKSAKKDALSVLWSAIEKPNNTKTTVAVATVVFLVKSEELWNRCAIIRIILFPQNLFSPVVFLSFDINTMFIGSGGVDKRYAVIPAGISF